jgi:hypothetical protein
MRYSNKEYKDALLELKDLIDDIQTADQMVFQSDLDNALSEAGNQILDELSSKTRSW